MILITIDNNQDFMRLRVNRSKAKRGLRKPRKKSWFQKMFAVRQSF